MGEGCGLKPGTIKKSVVYVSKFLPLLGVAGGAGGAAGAGAAGAGAAGMTAGQAAGAALNVASNLAESKSKKGKLLHGKIASAVRHANRAAMARRTGQAPELTARDRMISRTGQGPKISR